MDVLPRLRLISEVQKRRKLWMKKRKKNVDKLWAEIGQTLNTDASLCRRTWQKMRVRFWVEMKRVSIRIAKAKEKGTYDPNKKYTAWDIFETLRFLESIKSGHRKNLYVTTNSGIECVSITSSRKPYSKRKRIENSNTPIEDCELDIKNVEPCNINASESEFTAISSENAIHRNNIFFKEEPKLQIEADSSIPHTETFYIFQENESSMVSTTQQNRDFEGTTTVKDLIKNEYPDQSATSDEPYLRSPDFSDENYCFLYSFLSQAKLMSQSEKMEFRKSIKDFLLYIFPASSIDILENQQILPEDDDPDKKFLISFWPFMKSMSMTQNLDFRSQMLDLIKLFVNKDRS